MTRRFSLMPRKCPAIIGYMYSALIMLTTLYKYCLIGNIPWYAVQIGYIGVIGLSVLWIFLTGETSRVSVSVKFTAIYLLPYLLMLMDSMFIWVLNRKSMVFIRRGVVPIFYQILQIIAVGTACMMLGEDSAWFTAVGLFAGNGMILISVLLKRGIGTGISEMISFYLSFGNDDNLTSLSLEVHDLTFAMGELLIFYIAFDTKNKRRLLLLFLSGFFFLLGWKRSAIPGAIVSCLIGIICAKLPEKKVIRMIVTCGMFMILLSYLFIYIVRQGIVEWISKTYDIDMMGRNEMYAWIKKYYEFRLGYLGQGVGFITEVMKEAIESNNAALNHELSIHSDILARYIELGFFGNLFWAILTYIYTYYYIARHHSASAGTVYFAILFYCYITYFTDNTVSYYHINLMMRILPLSFVYAHQQKVIDMLEPKNAFTATIRKKPLV